MMGGGGGGPGPVSSITGCNCTRPGTVLSLRIIYQGSKTEFFSSDIFVKMSMAEL